MTPKQVKDIFNKLPSKRRKVLEGFLAGHSRQKIMIDADVPSDAALTGHLKELYKNFRIDTGWNDADDRRSGARKLPLLISLFARCMPELISDRIAEVPARVEQEELIAKPYQETVESDAGSVEERIFRATEQLNRRGFSALVGIQALEEIAKDSSRYHWKIMELLAAFVRNAPRRKEEEGIPDDIQAALSVIGQRDTEKDPENQKLDLSNADIAGAKLGQAKLQGAFLKEANLQGAYLFQADLQRANLIEANLQEAFLKKANLQEASLHQAKLRKADCQFANLQEAFLVEANLQEAVLYGANLEGAYLDQANLQEADLGTSKLRMANLRDTNLQEAYLQRAKLQRADLRGANLQEADLIEADLQGTLLWRANLRGAVLQDANLEGAKLWRANLEGTDFTDAINLTQQQIDQSTRRDSTTILPDYLK